MRKIVSILIVVFTVFLFSIDRVETHPEQDAVYICDSPGATKYHLSSTCRGLNACESKVIKVTKEEAVSKGKKTLCGWED